jgi:hypothetical protein
MSDIYNDSTELATLISVAAQEIVSQAKALGLVWTLRLATVSTASADTQTVIFDGDTAPLTVTNMSGAPLVSGQRVYGLIIPPAGNFVISQAGNPFPVGLVANVTGQALPNAASTAVTWTSVSYEVGEFTSPPSANFTIPTGLDGLYTFTANVLVGASGTRNFIEVSDNGGLWIRSFFAGGETLCSVSGTRYFTAGTSFGVNVFQNSGGPTTMTSNIWAYRVG